MSLRWTLTLLCVVLAITFVYAQNSNVAAATPKPAAVVVAPPKPVQPSQPPKPNDAPHVQAVNVAKEYSDEYDEDEDADDDFFLVPPAAKPAPKPKAQKTEKKSTDERIAAQKFKIGQLQDLLAKQREKHAATAQLIAKRNKEIQKRLKKHAAEMTKAADIQRRRAALDRAERAEKAQKAAAKRAAEIKAKQKVYALQKLLAQQRQAANLAERTLARQEQEDAVRQRVIATQHQTYQALEAELRAHEAEWGKRQRRKLKQRIQIIPIRSSRRGRRSRSPARRKLSRRVTFTARIPSNPFMRITPNPSYIPRRRLLSRRLRRWIIIRSIRVRRASPPPAKFQSITVARLQYKQARVTARATLKAIVTRRIVKRRDALASFKKLSQEIAVTAALAQSALIRATSNINRKLNRIARRAGVRVGRRGRGRRSALGRRSLGRRRGISRRPLYRRRPSSRRAARLAALRRRRAALRRRRAALRRARRSPLQFKLVDNPYPSIVSTADVTGSAPRPAKAPKASSDDTKLSELNQQITQSQDQKQA